MFRLLLMLPVVFVSCGSVFQGPGVGSIELEHPADAAYAVAFLRCRGGGFHGEITTDSEHARVRASGGFTFLGSLTFPTTEQGLDDSADELYVAAHADNPDHVEFKIPAEDRAP